MVECMSGSLSIKLGMIAHDYKSTTQEVETGESEVQGQLLLQSQFEASLGNMRFVSEKSVKDFSLGRRYLYKCFE